MKVLAVAVIVLGVALGPGLFLARRKPRGDEDSRRWLGQVAAVGLSLAWVAALLLIVKEVF